MPLPLLIPERELWDERNEEFVYVPETTLLLEHSLISISRWEAKYCKSFFEGAKSGDELLDYIKFMTLNKKPVNPNVYLALTRENVEEINRYIEAPMTATTIKDTQTGKRSSEMITSELIYYWMIQFNIPHEFEKWHINRLIMLIRVCSEKQKPAKKMSQAEIARQNRALNKARRAKLHSKG